MRRSPLFELSGVAVELLGIGALALAFPPQRAAFVPALAAIGLAYAALGWTPRRALSKRWEEALIAAMMGVAWLVSRWVRDGFLASALFLAYAQVCFRLSCKESRYRGLLWSFLSLIVASCFRPDLPFFLYLLLYGAAALVHMRELAERPDGGPVLPAEPQPAGAAARGRRRLGSTLLAAAAVFALGIALFPALPRVGASDAFWQVLRRRVAGFSDMTDLGEAGRIQPSGRLALRLTSARPIRLRGRAYEKFNGARWESAFGPRDIRVFRDVRPGQPARDGVQLAYVQEVSRHGATVFAPLGIERFTLAPARILVDPNGNLTSVGGDGPPRRFGFTFRPDPVFKPAPDGEAAVPPGRARGLAGRAAADAPAACLDVSTLGPRARELAQTLFEGAPDAPSKIARALAFFGQGFEYTLDARTRGRSPLDSFLFESRQGHCEFYASALAMLLRAGGVPTRYVTGYLAREENRIGGDYYVFEDDAHAWVEAYVPAQGWVPVDATPPGYAAGGTGSRWSPLQKRLIAWWAAYVVSYSREDQLRLYAAFGRGARAAAGMARALPGRLAVNVPAALLAAAVLAAAALLRRAAPAARSARGHLAFYRAYERILRRRGFRRAPGETPLQLSRRAAALGAEEAQRTLVRNYYALRYGGPDAPREDAAAIADSLRALRLAAPPRRVTRIGSGKPPP